MFRKREEVTHEVTFTQPSMTIPDQALTIRQILDRYAKGLPLGGHDINAAFYDEESEGINPHTLDLVDIEQISEETMEKVNKLRKQSKNKQEKQSDEKPEVKQTEEAQ